MTRARARATLLAMLLGAALLGATLPGLSPLHAQPAPLPGLSPPPAPAPDVWEPRSGVELRALNKVDARATPISLKVGQSAGFGSLTITLRACLARPADQPADSAAYLEVQDSRPGVPAFKGWILAAEPELQMLEHPVYGLRVIACR